MIKSSLNHADIDDCALETTDGGASIYHTLLYTVLQKPREKDQGGVVIALSSSNPGEGVTYVARALLHELAKCELNSVAGVNVSFLRKLHEPTVEAIRNSIARQESHLAGEIPETGGSKRSLAMPSRKGPWEASWQYRRDCIRLLREEFDYTIIDCPSLKESGDLLSIAPFVDGIILVVEANRTRRDQPRQAEQRITAAGGNLLGYILNKRVYEVPQWIYADA
jgi:Mrp family chromosome partitioning ATPase